MQLLSRLMQSDPWWSLAMAVNVFLVFYFRTSPDSFRRWWWVYCLICYGGPFVFAITLLFVKKSGQPPVYGEATVRFFLPLERKEIWIDFSCRSGVGLTTRGVISESTRITCSSGFVLLDHSSSTSWLGTTYSAPETSSEASQTLEATAKDLRST